MAKDVLVGRIEIEVVATIGLVRAMRIHRDMVRIGIRHRGFPLAAPGWSARRRWQAGDRFGTRLVDPER
ncbi:hypothetical protein D3C76_1714190 [compost metagenome]